MSAFVFKSVVHELVSHPILESDDTAQSVHKALQMPIFCKAFSFVYNQDNQISEGEKNVSGTGYSRRLEVHF